MKSMTLAACLLAVMLGALVAPSTETALSVGSERERLVRLFLEARKKGKNKGNGKGKGNKSAEDESQIDVIVDMAKSGEGGHHSGEEKPKLNFVQNCENGEIDNDGFCTVISKVVVVVSEREPCRAAAEMEPPASEDLVNACIDSIDFDLGVAADPATTDDEYFRIMGKVDLKVMALAKAMGVMPNPEGEGGEGGEGGDGGDGGEAPAPAPEGRWF